MQLTHISVDERGMETIRHGSVGFPMKVYTDDFEKYDIGYIRWHWHNEIEFAVVLQGEVEFFTGEQSICLQEGEGLFINSGIIHMAKAKGAQNAIMFTVVVNALFISDGEQSIINKKYVVPLLKCSELSFIMLNVDNNWKSKCIELLKKIYLISHEEEFAFELHIRNYICEIWLLLVTNTQNTIRNEVHQGPSKNQQRIKQMIMFIHHHYHEPMTLSDIATAAHISKSECYRCFLTSIGMKPFEYVIECRIENASRFLVETEMTITDVALACGFNSTSYFGMMFKKHTGTTPLKFRHKDK